MFDPVLLSPPLTPKLILHSFSAFSRSPVPQSSHIPANKSASQSRIDIAAKSEASTAASCEALTMPSARSFPSAVHLAASPQLPQIVPEPGPGAEPDPISASRSMNDEGAVDEDIDGDDEDGTLLISSPFATQRVRTATASLDCEDNGCNGRSVGETTALANGSSPHDKSFADMESRGYSEFTKEMSVDKTASGCQLCRELIISTQEAVVLRCGHVFHPMCIEDRAQCPICDRKVETGVEVGI